MARSSSRAPVRCWVPNRMCLGSAPNPKLPAFFCNLEQVTQPSQFSVLICHTVSPPLCRVVKVLQEMMPGDRTGSSPGQSPSTNLSNDPRQVTSLLCTLVSHRHDRDSTGLTSSSWGRSGRVWPLEYVFLSSNYAPPP